MRAALTLPAAHESGSTERKGFKIVQAPGFEPGLRAWKALVLPDYTTPAQKRK